MRWYKKGKALLDEIADSNPPQGEAYIWFAGQHGFIISLGGLTFYIDVILNDLTDMAGNSLRAYMPPFYPDEIQKVHYVLCTHNHADHLNLDTLLPLAKANPQTRFIVPVSCRGILSAAGIGEERILPARAGTRINLAAHHAPHHAQHDCSIVPVFSVHTKYIQDDGERDENGDYVSLGYIIKSGGLSVYHSGDTWVTPKLLNVLKEEGPFDIAMLPINGTDWERSGKDCIGNMSPLDAAKLAMAIPVDMTIPSHYDLIAHNSENPASFAHAMYTICPEKRFHIFALGERFIYRK